MRRTTVLFDKMFTRSAIKATEKEIELKVPWGKLAGLTWGSPSNPAVVLCHGRLDACSSFRHVLPYLPDHYYYVSYDLPGNGRSDPMPAGAPCMMTNFVPSLASIQEYFKWDKFIFVGHSMGVAIGKYYNFVYPGLISRMVDIDPLPAYLPGFRDLRRWYLISYEKYYKDFDKYSGDMNTAPKYSYQEIRQRVTKARGISEEVVDSILERCLVPTDDGLYRTTFDQRQKIIFQMPFSFEARKEIYMAPSTPTLAILAEGSVQQGVYKEAPYVFDNGAWPNKNYKFTVMEGDHDIHLQNPAGVCKHIAEFLEKADVEESSDTSSCGSKDSTAK